MLIYLSNIVFMILKDLVTHVASFLPELDDIEENNQGITGVFQLWYKTKRCPYTWDAC